MPNPVILAFDTSAAHCAAAVLLNGEIAGLVAQDMAKGQAEFLPDIIDQALAQAGSTLADVTAIAVGTGPGNFTGIRISVAMARGLAMALGIPSYGVTLFDAIWHGLTDSVTATVPAPREQVYFANNKIGAAHAALGTIAQAQSLGGIIMACPTADQLVHNIAHVGWGMTQTNSPRPTPFYIKPADAAPSRDIAPQRLSK